MTIEGLILLLLIGVGLFGMGHGLYMIVTGVIGLIRLWRGTR